MPSSYLTSALVMNERFALSNVQRGPQVSPLGAHANILFNTPEYVVEFTDKSSKNYFANVIAEYTYAQIDSEGNQYQLLSKITDRRSDHSAIQIADGFTTSCIGNCVLKTTTLAGPSRSHGKTDHLIGCHSRI